METPASLVHICASPRGLWCICRQTIGTCVKTRLSKAILSSPAVVMRVAPLVCSCIIGYTFYLSSLNMEKRWLTVTLTITQTLPLSNSLLSWDLMKRQLSRGIQLQERAGARAFEREKEREMSPTWVYRLEHEYGHVKYYAYVEISSRRPVNIQFIFIHTQQCRISTKCRHFLNQRSQGAVFFPIFRKKNWVPGKKKTTQRVKDFWKI